MPEFDTRRPPQGPSRLSKLLASAVDGLKSIDRHRRRWVSSLSDLLSSINRRRRWTSPAVGLLRSIGRHRRSAIFSSLFLVVLAVGFIVYWQQSRPEPWPPLHNWEYAGDHDSCSYNVACFAVYTDATDKKALIYITKQVGYGYAEAEVNFHRPGDRYSTFAKTAYRDSNFTSDVGNGNVKIVDD